MNVACSALLAGRPDAGTIVQRAIDEHNPVALRVGFSGGRDSLAITHWMMTHYPETQVFHCNTGIGIERTREFVRQTCKDYGWPLIEIRAKEDCGQDYDAIVKSHGFPGPDGHRYMYSLLKERPIRKLVRDAKAGHKRRDCVLIAAGVRHDESVRRMGYGGQEVNRQGGQLWVTEMARFLSLNSSASTPSPRRLPTQDFETEGFRKLRASPAFVFIRSTEPYLDVYADFGAAGVAEACADAGFGRVEAVAATGRHYALVAAKDGGRAAFVDRREATKLPDTHLKTWESKYKS